MYDCTPLWYVFSYETFAWNSLERCTLPSQEPLQLARSLRTCRSCCRSGLELLCSRCGHGAPQHECKCAGPDTVDKASVQCNDAAGFLHARQKAASHGNLASQDADTSQVQDAGHSDHGAPQQRRHLLPQSMSAVLSMLHTSSPSCCYF